MLPRTAEGIVRGSFFRSAYELFFSPMPETEKRAAKVVLDIGFDRIGTLIGSGLLAIAVLWSRQPTEYANAKARGRSAPAGHRRAG